MVTESRSGAEGRIDGRVRGTILYFVHGDGVTDMCLFNCTS